MTRPRRSPAVEAWLDSRPLESLFISETAVGELLQGIFHLPESKRRAEIELWLERDVLPMFAGRILPVDRPTWTIWGRLSGEAMRRGKPLPVIEALLLATAISHDLTLATRDRGVAGLGARVVDPWRK